MSYQEFLQTLGVSDSPAMQKAYMGFTSPEGLPGQMPGPAATSQLGFGFGADSPLASGSSTDPENYSLASESFYGPKEELSPPMFGYSQDPVYDSSGRLVSRGITPGAGGPQYQDPEMFSTMPYESQPVSPAFNPGTDPALMQQATNQAALQNAQSAALYSGADSTAMAGPELMTAEAGAQGAAEAGGSSFGGPATFAGNMALNMIPTRDREKVDTPFGNEGSTSGMIKGTGKGALMGATIGSQIMPGKGTAIGAGIGGTLGLLGGAQGYFDSTSAPIMQVSRIKQNRGLLGGGGANLYG